MKFRTFVREFPVLGKLALALYIFRRRGSAHRIIKPQTELSNFWPNSDGKYGTLSELLFTSINNLPEYFDELIFESSGEAPKAPVSIDHVIPGHFGGSVGNLRRLFEKYGSDKHTHRYHEIYGRLFQDVSSISSVVEIGIGTNNENVVSHMGKHHQGSGGSLRAFRDFFPKAHVVGLDIDHEALFIEDRITTFYFDQNGPTDQLGSIGFEPASIDLFIDDGLHLFGANLKGLIHGLRYVRPGGWIAIEDLTDSALGAWRMVDSLLTASGHRCYLIRAEGANVLLVKKSH